MGQILHGSARTTEAVRRAIQLRQESVRAAAKRYGVSPTTIQKWRDRETTADAAMGPKEPRSTTLTPEEEAIVVAFRRHTLLPLDDCLYGLQPMIPHLTRSSLHRCLQRHGISRLPEVEGDKPDPALRGCLQSRPPPQDAARPDILRVHLSGLDGKARTLQDRPVTPHSETIYLRAPNRTV